MDKMVTNRPAGLDPNEDDWIVIMYVQEARRIEGSVAVSVFPQTDWGETERALENVSGGERVRIFSEGCKDEGCHWELQGHGGMGSLV